MKIKGIKERLQSARTVAELEKVYAEGRSFEDVPPATQRRWARVHSARFAFLNAKEAAPTPATVEEPETTPNKKQNNKGEKPRGGKKVKR